MAPIPVNQNSSLQPRLAQFAASTGSFVKNHQKALSFLAASAGATYYLSKLSLSSLLQVSPEAQRERQARKEIVNRYERAQTDADFIIEALFLESLSKDITSVFNVEHQAAVIRKSKKKAKREAIEQLGESVESVGAGQGASVTSSQNVLGLSLSSSVGESQLVGANGAGTNGADAGVETHSQVLEGSRSVQNPETKTKAQLWNELKVISLGRTFTSLYVLSCLTFLTHLQISLISRSTYVNGVLQQTVQGETSDSEDEASDVRESDDLKSDKSQYVNSYMDGLIDFPTSDFQGRRPECLSSDTQRQLLSLSHWLVKTGWVRIAERVKSAVEDATQTCDLRQEFTYEEFCALVERIRMRIERDSETNFFDFSSVILPPSYEEIYGNGEDKDDSLRQVLDELSDVVTSMDGRDTLALLFDVSFGKMSMEVAKSTFAAPNTNSTVVFATLFMRVSNEADMVLRSLPNEYVDLLRSVPELQDLSAIVYASFYDTE